MARVIAISSQKGGVLKSTICSNLSGLLAKQGYKVLIVDTDTQANIALSFGLNPDDFNTTIYDVMVDGVPAEYAIRNIYENIDLLSSNDDFSFFEFDVLTQLNKYTSPFTLLKDQIKHITGEYDYIIIDTPPNMGLTQGNVLSFVDEVIIPFQPEVYSMRSLVKMLNAIKNFRDEYNPNLKVLGVVATLVDGRTSLHSSILQKARKYCLENDIRMFKSVIPRTIKYANSIAYNNLPATLALKDKKEVKAYHELLEEIKNG